MNLGKSIRVGQAMVGMTQREVASDIGINVATLNQIAKGKRLCRSDVLERLAACFNMKVSEFIALGE